MAAFDPSPDHCLKEKCLDKDNKKNSDMIRCIICCTWHHAECVSVARKDTTKIWSCFECRMLPKTVNELKKEISDMHDQQKDMMALLRIVNAKLDSETEEKSKIAHELNLLKNSLNSIKTDSQTSNDQNEAPQPEVPVAPPIPSLFLGTSILRNVDPDKLQNCDVIAEGGASIPDLQAALCKLPDEKKFEEITVIGGSIDIETKSTDEVISDYQALLVSTSERTEKSTICSILPRTDKNLTDKRKKTNDALKTMCEKDGHTFLDMDDTFLLRNGSANKSFLLKDGLHLTKDGLDNLIKQCNNGTLKENLDSVYTDQRYKKVTEKHLFKGHESPLSNFYPVAGLVMDNIRFATSEAAYVYFKARHHNYARKAEAVKRSKTGIQEKRIGDGIVHSGAKLKGQACLRHHIVIACFKQD